MFKGIYWGRSAIFSTIGGYIGGYICLLYRTIFDIRYIEHGVIYGMYVSVFILKVYKVYIYSLWLSLKSVKAFTINISYNHEVRL